MGFVKLDQVIVLSVYGESLSLAVVWIETEDLTEKMASLSIEDGLKKELVYLCNHET